GEGGDRAVAQDRTPRNKAARPRDRPDAPRRHRRGQGAAVETARRAGGQMSTSLIDQLKVIERQLPKLFKGNHWHSLYVDYEPPTVERLWTDVGNCRLYLHRIHPCEKALYHAHPWPSAIKVLSGVYEMAV